MPYTLTDKPTSYARRVKGLKGRSAQTSYADNSILTPPEPRYRETPADVRRRENRTVRAEPPPPPPPQVIPPLPTPKSGRRKKQSNSFDGDSGSDSDDTSNQGRDGESDAPIARRVRQSAPGPIGTSRAGPSTSPFLTREKKENTSFRRALMVGSKSVLSAHHETKNNAGDLKVFLANEYKLGKLAKARYGSGEHMPTTERIQYQKERMYDYMNETIYRQGGVVPSRSLGDVFVQPPNSLLFQEVVIRIESDFTVRWENRLLDNQEQMLRTGIGGPFTGERFAAIVESLYGCMSKVPINHLLSKQDQQYELANTVELKIGRDYRFKQAAGIYQRKVLLELADCVIGNAATGEERHVQPRLIDRLKISRSNGLPTDEHIHWIQSLLGAHMVSKCQHQRYRQMVGERIRNTAVSRLIQGFYENEDGHINFIILKDGHPLSNTYVDDGNFASFGWFRDYGYDRKYCRYEYDAGHDAIFKVAIDGKVLALCKPEGLSLLTRRPQLLVSLVHVV
ncbi:hypothetical protein GGS26DRAFT_269097 [Hypomontagnella submonticulosa]|nr:hypothetical protein GGS26DRAFT_269097 [Hypomontagnella submonticulosa]